MMRSPTVLTILPEGGDSRKQVMMVFVLAVLGCAVFTTYASGLFFRQKSREIGTFLALGATRHQLKTELSKELALLSLGSCAAGALLGVPLSWGIWQIFRTMIVDTEEMVLRFDAQAYLFALAFSVFVILMLFLMGWRSRNPINRNPSALSHGGMVLLASSSLHWEASWGTSCPAFSSKFSTGMPPPWWMHCSTCLH